MSISLCRHSVHASNKLSQASQVYSAQVTLPDYSYNVMFTALPTGSADTVAKQYTVKLSCFPGVEEKLKLLFKSSMRRSAARMAPMHISIGVPLLVLTVASYTTPQLTSNRSADPSYPETSTAKRLCARVRKV